MVPQIKEEIVRHQMVFIIIKLHKLQFKSCQFEHERVSKQGCFFIF